MSSPGLVAHFTGIEIEGKFEDNIVDVGRGRFVVVYVDEQEGWRSKKRSSGSPLRWQEDYRISFRPCSSIKIEVFRKSRLSVMFPHKQHIIGRFSGRLVELLGNDTGFDMIDDTGTRLDGIKIKIKLTLISDSPRDLMGRVDAAISRLDDSVLSQISRHVDRFTPMTKFGDSAAQVVDTCIPSLGQTFKVIVNIARTFGDAHPILKMSCIVLFSVYEAFKDEAVLSEAVRDLAESLREMVYVAHKRPDLLVIEGTENVIEAIGRVSMQIACLIDEYARLPLSIRTVRDALSNDMKTRVELSQARCRDLKKKFSTRIKLETNQIIHQIHNGQIAEQFDTFLGWLKAPDPSRNYNSARERHQEGTGTWFFSGEQLSEWKRLAGSLLWVYGIPGCGKTILCSSIIEDVSMHCATNTSFAVAYFFFDSRDAQDGLQRHDGLLCCLIKQLSLQCDEMPYGLEELLGGGRLQPSQESLRVAVELLLAKFKHAYIIVDSLDECIERSKLLGWLQRIIHLEVFKRNTHLLVTSRDELDIRQCLQTLGAVQVCIQGKSVDDDIRSYIDRTLSTGFRVKWSDIIKGEIREKVLTISRGMFRLAALQLEELQSCYNVRELKTQLDQLPRNLYETYDRVLSKLNEGHRQKALRVLQWLAFSARLLRLIELSEVLAVDLETKPYPRFCNDLRYGPEIVSIICTNLIVVSTEGNVQLAHLSVKEYILTSTSLQNFGFTTNEKLSHSLIAQTCLAYLLQFETPEILTEDTLESFPLAQYAADHWVSHAHAGAGDSRVDPLNTLIDALFTGNDTPFIAWVRLNDLDNPASKRDMIRLPVGSRLYYACLAGLQDLSIALLDAGEAPDTKGSNDISVLQMASWDGQYRTVRHLLEKGAQVNMEGSSGSALKLASSKGYREIVQLLLDNGADVNMQGREFDDSRALQEASYWGHEDVVRLLLENGAEVNLLGGASGSALQAAARGGHESIVRLLVENGAEMDVRSGMYGTALHDASKLGHIDIVRFLLESGANVDMSGGQYNTALQAASQGGHEGIVRLLLEKGADVGKLGGRFGSALQAAASGGKVSFTQRTMRVRGQKVRQDNAAVSRGRHTSIVLLLLEKGAQVNMPLGGYHGSALRAASSEGHKESVQLLLGRGAEVNTEDERYGSALQAAALEGHEEILMLLIAHGANVNMPKEPCGSALQAAAYGGYTSIVRLLLDRGAELNKQSKKYGDALQAASMGGHEPTVRLLLEQGADINVVSNEHGDALQAASMEGHEHIVRILLENGADIHLRRVGLFGSALQAASKMGHQKIVELLLEKGAARLNDDA